MHPRTTYVLFTALWGAGMGATATTYVPGLMARGLSLADIAAVNIFFWLSISVMELPTGLLADGKSRAWSVRAGSAFCAAGAFGYATAGSFWQAAFWESVIGVGFAFLSGAMQAWLTDALAKRGERNAAGRAFGAAAAARAGAAIVAGTVGACLGVIDLRLGWLLSGCCHAAAAFVAFRQMNGDGEPAVRMTESQALSASVAATRRTPGLPWALAMATAFGLVLPFNHYWTPFFRERIGQAGLAVVWAPFFLAVMAGGMAVRRGGLLASADHRGIVFAHFLTGAGLAAAGLLPGVMLPFAAAMVHEFGRGLYEPLMDAYVQDRVGSGFRATYASFQSLVARAGYGIILVAVWAVTRGMASDGRTIGAVWLAAGGLLVVAALSGWAWRPRARP